jgi:hypothetical protein
LADSDLLLISRALLQALLYTGLSMAYFVYCSLSPLVHANGELAGGGSGAASSHQKYFVLGAGALQLVVMWWLGLALEA